MKTRWIAGGLVGLSLLFLGGASIGAQTDAQTRKQIAQGRGIYMSYCASCHGVDATGNGLVAPALKRQPSDLTRVKKVDGKFPAKQIQAIITGEMSLPVHGEKEMPVWGGIIKDADLTSLVRYIESIQRPLDLPPGG
ncbi:MAG: cytochrome c [Blastocatellia bacterium]|nr:cytochrome c [Blastocatellia bacterium]